MSEDQSFIGTRLMLHQVASHILARARHRATGRFGLRATPGGFGTPGFGEPPTVLRLAGSQLIREVAKESASVAVNGSTLGELAMFAGVDLAVPFSAGDDTPSPWDPDVHLELDEESTRIIADWYGLGWTVLDSVAATFPKGSPSVVQLWPEHFDAACDFDVGNGRRVTVGFSPGDNYEPGPYLYVGPWDRELLAADAYWSAPFGISLSRREVLTADRRSETCTDFILEAVRHLRGS